mmetsp:Transcript_54629/g.117305  ORF Transcript_54629/g.117305 Transcript_54629/m.117305 type:complete len:390 (+) Transcript_54629:57-1226(+)
MPFVEASGFVPDKNAVSAQAEYSKAVDDREGVVEGNPAQQSSRDNYFMNKLQSERNAAKSLTPPSEEQLRKSGERMLRSPSRGVWEILKSIDASASRQISCQLEHSARTHGLEFEHLGTTIGTVIGGVDLSSKLSSELVAVLRRTLLERKVIFFRGQTMSEEQHKDFCRHFGSLEVHPFAPPLDGHPEILRISHGPASPGTENVWHSDVTWRVAPSMGSVLFCRQKPAFGGDTLFADAAAIYEGLGTKVQQRLEGAVAVHDFHNFRATQLRAGVSVPVVEELRRAFPVAKHPVVRTHPETGKKMLYVNAAFTRYIEGLPREQSDKLLMLLYSQANCPEYQCRFRWEEGSVAFWDNRACLHLATSDYYPQGRMMDRVTIQGDVPFYKSNL